MLFTSPYLLYFLPVTPVKRKKKCSSCCSNAYRASGTAKKQYYPTQQDRSNLIFNPPHGEAGHTCALAVGAPLNQTAGGQPQKSISPQPVIVPASATIHTSGKKLNPKHGTPGHRCDIAVGAPLDSKPTQVVTTTQPAVTQVPAVKVGKGLNPPHGQPNHRCDLAVGAPLNSKPASVVNPAPEVKTNETKVLETKTEG